MIVGIKKSNMCLSLVLAVGMTYNINATLTQSDFLWRGYQSLPALSYRQKFLVGGLSAGIVAYLTYLHYSKKNELSQPKKSSRQKSKSKQTYYGVLTASGGIEDMKVEEINTPKKLAEYMQVKVNERKHDYQYYYMDLKHTANREVSGVVIMNYLEGRITSDMEEKKKPYEGFYIIVKVGDITEYYYLAKQKMKKLEKNEKTENIVKENNSIFEISQKGLPPKGLPPKTEASWWSSIMPENPAPQRQSIEFSDPN